MADPIEQAWRAYDSAFVSARGKGWTPERAEYVNMKQQEVIAAILHHHPDVVRSVLAARRLSLVDMNRGRQQTQGDKEAWNRQMVDAWADFNTALAPFKEVQE